MRLVKVSDDIYVNPEHVVSVSRHGEHIYVNMQNAPEDSYPVRGNYKESTHDTLTRMVKALRED